MNDVDDILAMIRSKPLNKKKKQISGISFLRNIESVNLGPENDNNKYGTKTKKDTIN